MIKSILSVLGLLLLSYASYGQTIVSTSPENKKVILEEFTGIHCVFCPQGHAIAQAIQDNNPDEVFLINIHVGSFAVPGINEPDFRTPFGSAIAGQSGLLGYPAGTVNRRNFPGLEQGASGTTAMGRNAWTTAANQVLGQSSYVNVGVEADIDVSTSELTVHMEGYYTGDSPESTNLVNVALLQNNTLGPQTGGNVGNEYVHMHRLVHMVTGQWGIPIPTTTTGTLVDETFTYTIPADYNGVPVELYDLEVVSFITETHQEVASGNGATPTFSGFAHANDAFVRYVEEIDDQCGFDVSPVVNVQNLGSDTITSLAFDYSVNSGPVQTYNWTGTITPMQYIPIELDPIAYTVGPVNTVDITLQNDDNNTNNAVSGTFNNAIEGTGSVRMILNTSNQGGQLTWDLRNSAGTVLYSGGPYGNNETIFESFDLAADCHRYSIYNAVGNGSGSIVIHDDTNTVLWSNNGSFDDETFGHFNSNGVLGVEDNLLDSVNIYPNPATSVLNIRNAQNADIEVYNMLGQVLYTKNNISLEEQVQVSHLNGGTYFVKIVNGKAVKTAKFIKR